MATVTFPNGKSVTFEGDPTPDDIDEVARELGITAQNQEINPAQPTVGGAAANFGVGVAKELGSAFQGLGQLGEGVLRQTAGRLVSATQGKGLVPTPKEQLMYSDESPSGSRMREAFTPQGVAQKAGYYATKGAELLLPFGAYKAVTKAPASAEALSAVAPKLTPSKVREAYQSGRAGVSGLLRRVGIGPDEKTVRAAKASEGLVKANRTAAENSLAVHDEIGREAIKLKSDMRGRDFKLIVQQEDLSGLYQKVMNEISENPTMVGNAAESAKRIFTKFNSFLPKGREITAEDILDARQKLDVWMKSQRGDKVFDPATENAISISLRAIRQGANDLMASKAPDVAVKESLARQTALYDALENIATKGVSEVGSTAIGRYLSRHPIQKEAVKVGLQALPLGLGGYLGARAIGD